MWRRHARARVRVETVYFRRLAVSRATLELGSLAVANVELRVRRFERNGNLIIKQLLCVACWNYSRVTFFEGPALKISM